MSWITRRATPRPDEAAFHARRMARERFEKPYLKPTAAYRFVRAVYTVPLGLEDMYYMSLDELTSYIMAAARDLAEERGWDTVVDVTARARREGRLKDTPLVVALAAPERRYITTILGLDYPVSKLLTYAEAARRLQNVTWGSMRKKAIAETLAAKDTRWHEFQAVKYRRRFARLLRLVHPRPPSREAEEIWGWVVGKRRPPTDYIEAYVKAVRLAESGDREGAVRTAIEHRLPWEVVRSRIGGLGGISAGLLKEAAAKLMTGYDVALQASMLAERLGEEEVTRIVAEKRVPREAAARATVGLALRGELVLAKAFAAKARAEPDDIVKDLLGGWRPNRVVALIDVSASMTNRPIRAALMLYTALHSIVEKTYVFNGIVGVSHVETPHDEDGVAELIGKVFNMTAGSTPLYDSVREVVRRERLGNDDLLIVFTDEQENASTTGLERLASVASTTNVLAAVVVGYPTPMIPPVRIRQGRVYGVAVGHSYEALAASARALALEKQLVEGVVEPDDVYAMLGLGAGPHDSKR